MHIYESVVREDLLQEFPIQGPATLFNYAANLVGLPGTLSVVSLLWPRIVEDEGLVFLAEYYSLEQAVQKSERFKKLTFSEKQQEERTSNAVSLGQYFYSEKIEVLENKTLLDTFGETLKFFWSMRLQNLFPSSEFIIELGENIAGEEGVVITFYHKEGIG